MAIMCPPEPMEYEPASREGEIFEILHRGLNDEYYVFHSVTVSYFNPDTRKRVERECDFIIFHPEKGILCIEAKAGHIRCENRVWKYASGKEMKNKSPYLQVEKFTYALRDLIELRGLGDLLKRCKYLYAVWFPMITRQSLCNESQPTEMELKQTICANDSGNIQAVIERIFALNIGSVRTDLSKSEAKKLLQNVFAPEFDLVPIPHMVHENQVISFSRMLDEQNALLGYLEEQDRAAINGMAGTGKTLMAVEKARRHAMDGERVLFLCYNDFLMEHLRKTYQIENVDFYTLDGFALRVTGQNTDRMSALEGYLNDCYESRSFPYRHIIIDEAQDFGRKEAVQAGIIDLLSMLVLDNDFNQGTFYVFYDKNQLVHCEAVPAAIEKADCRLTLYRNCRNTFSIAQTAGKFLNTNKPLRLKDTAVKGEQPEFFSVSDPASLQKALDSCIRRALTAGIEDIVILTCKTEETSMLHSLAPEGTYECENRKILFTTCRKFKGLEADAVFLIDADAPSFSDSGDQPAYVGASRARFRLAVLTCLSREECAVLLEAKKIDPGRNPFKTLAAQLMTAYMPLK